MSIRLTQLSTYNVLWKRFICSASGLLLLLSFPVFADTHIAILDFELNDLTLLPRTPEELGRTALVTSLLQEALAKKGGYGLVAIDLATQAQADASFGYLFDHPDVAAKFGRRFGAKWIGYLKKLTERGTASLAEQIDQTIKSWRSLKTTGQI